MAPLTWSLATCDRFASAHVGHSNEAKRGGEGIRQPQTFRFEGCLSHRPEDHLGSLQEDWQIVRCKDSVLQGSGFLKQIKSSESVSFHASGKSSEPA